MAKIEKGEDKKRQSQIMTKIENGKEGKESKDKTVKTRKDRKMEKKEKW